MNPVLSSLKRVFHLCLDRLHTHFIRWTKPLNASLLLGTSADLGKSKSELMAENAVLATWHICSEKATVRAIKRAFAGCKKTCS